MNAWETLGLFAVVAFAAKTGAWLLQLKTGNAGIVDGIWAFTLGGMAVIAALVGDAPDPMLYAVGIMGGVWGMRLGIHLWRRNWGAREDFRYAEFRARWGKDANRNMFWFFQFQNVFTLLLAGTAFLPIAFADATAPAISYVFAAVLWITSVAGESIADAQMNAFRTNPINRGQVCRDGLWRYSRHPNYFFECLHWTAYVPLAIFAPYGWISIAAPVVMGLLITKMSGMPLLEKDLMKRKPDYAEYARTTSPLIPWPPRNDTPHI